MDHRGKEMQIYVKVFTGKVLKVVVRSWETVECMKEKIWSREGIPLFKQRIIFEGTELQNQWIVIDRIDEILNSKLKNGSTNSGRIHGRVVCYLLLRQTGGANVVFHKPAQEERRSDPHRPSPSSDQSSSSDSEEPHVIPPPSSSDVQTVSNDSAQDTSPVEEQSILTLRGAGKDIDLIVLMIVMAAFFLPKMMRNKVPRQGSKVNPRDINGKHDENKTELVEMVLKRLKDGGGISLCTILLIIIISVLLVILYFRVAKEKQSVQVEITNGSKKVKFTISTRQKRSQGPY